MDNYKKLFFRLPKLLRLIAYRIYERICEAVVVITLSLYYYTETVLLTLTPSVLRSEKSLDGRVILVTGGAGGVGQELTLRLARQKAKVVVWDNNEKALEKLKDKVKQEGFEVYTYAVDITDKNLVYKYASMVQEDVGPVNILINNAGIVCGNTFLEIPDRMIEKTFQVNILSHYWMTKAFLPDMLRKKNGHIVTIGSLTGLLGTYKCVDYSASKFATVGFHESLLTELQFHGQDYIKMTLVCPYIINTGMFDGCKPKTMPMLEPKDVAKRIIKAIKREEVFITIPWTSRFLIGFKSFVPAKLGWSLLHRVVKAPQAMAGLRSFHEIEAA